MFCVNFLALNNPFTMKTSRKESAQNGRHQRLSIVRSASSSVLDDIAPDLKPGKTLYEVFKALKERGR